ncbi:MAG: HD domain-containing protein [Patescibacteria group bacterium]|nr:HD domain-containing protein [Patescibacteria group bacterium]
MNQAQKLIEFIHYAERLKTELRHATRSDNQRESVADHTWRLSLMLMLVYPNLKLKIDLLKTLKMSIIHDIVEIEAKDIPVLEQINDNKLAGQKEKAEKTAIQKLKNRLGNDGQEIFDLWNEFENSKTNEAKIVKALDKLEGQLQFLDDPVRKFTANEQDSITQLLQNTKKLCEIDPFLQQLDEMTLDDRKKRISF